jgi:hypothetical protein
MKRDENERKVELQRVEEEDNNVKHKISFSSKNLKRKRNSI